MKTIYIILLLAIILFFYNQQLKIEFDPRIIHPATL
jgi:hypothetical protein